MMKLLRGIAPKLPSLWFRTQQTEGANRPDMWGYDDAGQPYVFVENKFWAGLTENQPISYLHVLAKHPGNTVLLMVAPKTREQVLTRELKQRLFEEGVSATAQVATTGVFYCVKTSIGPILALTSWEKLLSCLELELSDDQVARSNILQLRALCEAEDSDAVAPISAAEVSDQRTPGLILNLSSIVKSSVDLAVTEGSLDCRRLNPQADYTRIGRYAYLGTERKVGIWVGIHFGLWKAYGKTPLWVVFNSSFGRSREVRVLLEPWAAQKEVFSATDKNDFVVAIAVRPGDEKDNVVTAIAKRLKEIAEVLASIRPNPKPTYPEDIQ